MGGGYLIENEGFTIWLHGDKSVKRCLTDYKFYCFNGIPRYCQVISDRTTKEKIDFYDMEWNRVEGLVGLNPSATNTSCELMKPKNFDKIKECVTKLAVKGTFSRVDFYEVNNKPYFGEITLYPASGYGSFKPEIYNEILGDQIDVSL